MSDAALPPEETTLHEPPTPGAGSGSDVERQAEQEAEEAAERAPRPGGFPLEDDGMPSVEVMREAMKAVMDPEIGYNVVDLGLLYEITKASDGRVHVTMTLTSMGCPLTELIDQQVSVVLGSLPGVEDVTVDFTFTPPWSPDMISDEVRLELQAMGMNV
ncbi:MAG: metal-sulfur cluster assembly factor [Actinomycetota bacterium]|nr:metal-sulfur cluster assembly factor [Actinomycetota bacterium]